MWDLYNRLINQVHDGVVKDATVGISWGAIRSKTVGLGLSAPRPLTPFQLAGEMEGMPIRYLAEYVKSWELVEAAVGLSAINSSINTLETVNQLEEKGFQLHKLTTVFDSIIKIAQGKKVAVIGHFPSLEKLQAVCRLSILERRPQVGDLPDPAAEYILPEQDIVLITSSTIINKTAPRLLELAKNAFTILVGPSTPLSPVLFDMGVDMLSGLVVEDEARVTQCIREGGGLSSFRESVQFVNIAKANHPISQLLLEQAGGGDVERIRSFV